MNLTLERSYPIPFTNSPLLPLLILSLARQRHTRNISTKIKKEYDYIIVGAGSAGSVVASRLSELPCISVLLLEAGPKTPLLTEVPSVSLSFLSTNLDWQFLKTPQRYTGNAQINRQSAYHSGKALGGTSVINIMLYIRGNKRDCDDWEAMEAKGWSYKDVFPYFLKLEDNKDPKILANGYHVIGGPTPVHQPMYHPDILRALYKSAADLGYEIVDPNSAKKTGFYVHQATLRDSQRCTTAKDYLVPAENQTNLDILPNAVVTKIIIRKKRATGVRFDFKGQTYHVKARREVIISAGTIKTPHLLMLSGVGPKSELERFNIPVKVDLPVGKNLHNHAGTILPFEMKSYMPGFEQKFADLENIKEYTNNRTGSPTTFNMLAFLKGDEIRPAEDSPNYEVLFFEMVARGIGRFFRFTPEVYRTYFAPYDNKPLFACLVSEMQPRSRGTLTLRSKNPYDSPVINPNYLKDPSDVENLVQGMKKCSKIARSRHLRKLGIKPLQNLMPGCEMHADDEDNYFRCYLRSFTTAIHHVVGTAKMGDPSDPTTVVDTQLRVKYIEGLRVVDASVMPKITSGNTHIPTTMIAEKASDIIKKTIYCSNKHEVAKESSYYEYDNDSKINYIIYENPEET